MSYVSHAPGQSRVFDPIYDPLFIVSGPKDAWRANTFALSKAAPIRLFTKYDVMFSDLPKESRNIYWKQGNLLPHFRVPGGGDSTQGNTAKPINLDVTGKIRGCFFRASPDGCAANAEIINLQLDLPDEHKEKSPQTPEESFKNAACQTCYRESSAQTRPYQPDAIIGPGETEEPEILRISKLISGDNQPGEFEAKIIERVRRRRKWEKELPTLSSFDDFRKRAIVLEAFEWEEWMSREDEIEAIQKTRLDLVHRLLQKRDYCFQLKSALKLENSAKRIEAKRKKDLEKVKRNHERQLRKLEAKHNKIPKKYKKCNIVDEHIDPSSELHGPQIRFGVNPNRRHYFGFRKKFCARLDDLDRKIKEQPSLMCPKSKLSELAKPKELQKEITQGFRTDKNLKLLYEALKDLRNRESRKGIPKCLIEKEKEFEEYIATPIGLECDQAAEMDYQSRVYLQKIIKGRAVQTMIFVEKQKQQGLLDELNSTQILRPLQELCPLDANEKEKKKTLIISNQKRLMDVLRSEQVIKDILCESEAKIISGVFDFLEKELKRLYEQRKTHAIYMLAERERKKREAFEAGKRQRENQRREEHTEIYKDVTKASQDTITLYLENLLMEETNLQAEKDARAKIQAIAKHIDREASKIVQEARMKEESTGEKGKISSEEEDYIAELVNDFVFPEVQKQLARNRMELRRRKYVQAAHNELYQNVEDTLRKKVEPEPGPDTADKVISDLIIKAVDSEDALSELISTENIARHEAMSAIRKIIKRVLPDAPKWKKSAERVVSATISELTKTAVESETAKEKNKNDSVLEDIQIRITSELWEAAYADSISEPVKSLHKLPESINITTEFGPRIWADATSDYDEDSSSNSSETLLHSIKRLWP